MQLADTAVSGMERQELGMLIGGDHYWKVVSGKFWGTESIGIITEREIKKCDEETMHLFEKSVQFKEGDTR